MKATELRLGSLFDYKQCIYAANVIRDNFVYGKNVNGFAPGEFPIDKIKPIPLTEEWLLRFGFEKDEYAKDFRLGKYWVENRYFDSYEKSMFLFGCYQFNKIYITSNVNVLKYVHELQNLYFALTGEELTIQKQ